MKNSLVYLRPISLAFVRATGSYETAVPRAWDEMFAWLDHGGFRLPDGRAFGLARDNPAIAGDACRYDACVIVNPQIEHRALRELGIATMPGGSYARLHRKGSYPSVEQMVSQVFSTFEPPQGLALDTKRPVVTVYYDDPRSGAASEHKAEISVPITIDARAVSRRRASAQAA